VYPPQDEAMILFTGRPIHITKMTQKLIDDGYKFYCLADKGYVWDFQPSSNAVSVDPIPQKYQISSMNETSQIVYWLMRKLQVKHSRKS
jgi:hypothetical protein